MKLIVRALVVLTGVAALALAGVAVVRAAHLPRTECTVTYERAVSLPLERSYAATRDALGCDGVLVSREVWSKDLTREIYQWRGDAWPFGRLDGLFYNGVLHGTDVRWVTLGVTTASADKRAAPP